MSKSGSLDAYLPEPVGYRILVKPHEVKEKSAGGILLVQESQNYADIATYAGTVIKKGPDCYEGDKFASNWCNVGDTVIFARNVGQKIEVKRDDGGYEKYLMINDADVRATILDPTRIRMYL